jgi:flagellar basal body rod protein FlgC
MSIAASGMAAQSRRIEAAARSIASMGTAQSNAAGATGAPPVRIGALPVGDPIESVVTLIEAEQAYRMNAAVLKTADDMLGTLLDAVDPDEK